METSANGRKRLKREEGERFVAYVCSAGQWTIGVGHTSMAGPPKVYKGLRITAEESDEILARDLKTFEDCINTLVKVPLNQNEFDALVSLVFNIGQGAFKGSTVLRKLNAGDKKGAADAFLMWKKAGKDPDLLLPRRQRERSLFLTAAPVVVTVPEKGSAEAVQPVQAVNTTQVANSFVEWLRGLFKGK